MTLLVTMDALAQVRINARLGVCTPQTNNCSCNNDNDCAAPGQCQASVTCDLASGQCVYTDKPDTTPCNDNNACTQGEACHTGICGQPSSTTTCSATDSCHDAGTCDSNTGQCSSPAKTDGTVCLDDGNICNGLNTCAGRRGVSNSAPLDCDDHDPCTVDSCDAQGGCQHVAKSCDDGNACTTDTCDSQTGVCQNTNTCPNNRDSNCTDGDSDGDGVCNAADNCPNTANPTQAEANGNGVGDVCESSSNSGDPGKGGGSSGGTYTGGGIQARELSSVAVRFNIRAV